MSSGMVHFVFESVKKTTLHAYVLLHSVCFCVRNLVVSCLLPIEGEMFRCHNHFLFSFLKGWHHLLALPSMKHVLCMLLMLVALTLVLHVC